MVRSEGAISNRAIVPQMICRPQQAVFLFTHLMVRSVLCITFLALCIGAVLQMAHLPQPDDSGALGDAEGLAELAQDCAVPIVEPAPVVYQPPATGKIVHGPVDLPLGHQERRAQGVRLPLVPVLPCFQVTEGVGRPRGVGLPAGLPRLVRLHLEQYLVGALMGKGEPPLAAPRPDLSWLHEAAVQQHLVGFQRDEPGDALAGRGILRVRIGGQAADAPIVRQAGKGHPQAKVVPGKLVDGCGLGIMCFKGSPSPKEELVEVLGHGCRNLLNLYMG